MTSFSAHRAYVVSWYNLIGKRVISWKLAAPLGRLAGEGSGKSGNRRGASPVCISALARDTGIFRGSMRRSGYCCPLFKHSNTSTHMYFIKLLHIISISIFKFSCIIMINIICISIRYFLQTLPQAFEAWPG